MLVHQFTWKMADQHCLEKGPVQARTRDLGARTNTRALTMRGRVVLPSVELGY